ncbi:DHH family phosphoesterase [Clostridium senegalense]|uniref:DHH family phosphoesterase n=1 Tax=Clostridium senegalense TaxID=1465809 RepID=UPI00028881DB|nr:bifunctional oligoribonuclease/PAP phosphatase NrnA [Clostridium senegalense]
MNLEKVVEKIMESNSIAITFHVSPDGDSLGSATALMLALKSLNKNVQVLCKEEIPNAFSYLKIAEEINIEEYKPQENIDLVIVLDCGDKKRINAELDFENRKYSIINIDHHMSNEMYGDINYVSVESAAVGEIVFNIIRMLKIHITENMGAGIYTSLLTDTGSFRHSNTTKVTHEIAGYLIENGLNFSEIHRKIFDNKEFNRVKLYGKVIEKMEMQCENNAVFMYLNKTDLESLGIEQSDTSDLLVFGTKIKGADVTALIKEADNGVKVSLRSKEKVDVRKIAEGFNGGGHVRAAGFYYESTMEEIKEKLIAILEKELM